MFFRCALRRNREQLPIPALSDNSKGSRPDHFSQDLIWSPAPALARSATTDSHPLPYPNTPLKPDVTSGHVGHLNLGGLLLARLEFRVGLFQVELLDPDIAIAHIVTFRLELEPLRRVGDPKALLLAPIDS